MPLLPALSLPKTNMTADEMIPDTQTKGHDPRYWCLPPMCEDPDSVVAISGGYEFHLVSQGRQVGIWKSWTAVKAMVSGYPDGAHKGHHTYAGCIGEWQVHCQLGVHPHPADPGPSKGKSRADPANRGHRCSSSTPASQRTSGALSVAQGSRRGTARYFAIWGAQIVYSSKYKAKLVFDEAVDEGVEPELLSTDDFDVVLAYAEGHFF
ncbi:hypothetical protein B0H14DRAFT_3509128 [Mycena olivaceomarginata]|nr:hypothetical protein B0H14DRAFT_3509128 [Mycena olivaceomarginata]